MFNRIHVVEVAKALQDSERAKIGLNKSRRWPRFESLSIQTRQKRVAQAEKAMARLVELGWSPPAP